MAASLKQYLRSWSMLLNGQPFIDNRDDHQFRCVFDIVVSPDNTLALADIQIYNLSKQTAIEQRDDIVFSAGYRDRFDSIFIGTVTNVFKERRGPDVVTRLTCRSGQAAGDRGTMSSSYGAGTMVTDVLTDIARSWPRYLEMDTSQFTKDDVFITGYAAFGDIPTILNQLANAFDFRWMQDRGSLVITRGDKERTTTTFEVNQYEGMVGMPEVNRGPMGIGVDVTVRINPYIRATSRINVKSEFSTYNTGNIFIAEMAGDASATGEYNVFSIHYVGDSHGSDWDMRINAIRAGTRNIALTTGGSLIWGSRVSQEFRAKTRQISERQGLDPNWYMAVMAFETGRTFNPAELNGAGSGATGLIQFMPSTAVGLGTTTKALANMSAVEQLDYVEKYFRPYVGRIRNLGDMYMAVLWPNGIGKADDWVMWTTGSREYAQNAGLDTNHNGTITRGEAVGRVNMEFKLGEAYKA